MRSDAVSMALVRRCNWGETRPRFAAPGGGQGLAAAPGRGGHGRRSGRHMGRAAGAGAERQAQGQSGRHRGRAAGTGAERQAQGQSGGHRGRAPNLSVAGNSREILI